MKLTRRSMLLVLLAAMLAGLLSSTLRAEAPSNDKWPPALPTANADGTATITGPELLQVPAGVQHKLETDPKAARFTVATTPPTVDLAYHQNLIDAALNGTGWSAWGDICLASDGKVYVGVGNHGGFEKGQCYFYCWDPQTRTLKQLADVNKVNNAQGSDVRWSKVHAGAWEGIDKKIYFTCTLDDGGLAGKPPMVNKWNAKIRGGQIFQYDPQTGSTVVYANFPPARDTATTYFDPVHNILYCCLEGAPDGVALGAFDMASKQWIYQSPDGIIALDRKIMLDNKGNIYFNGREDGAHWAARYNAAYAKAEQDAAAGTGTPAATDTHKKHRGARAKPLVSEGSTLWKYDAANHTLMPTHSSFDDAGIRSATRESRKGWIYGTTMGGDLFKYNPEDDKLVLLGKDFLTGEYITVCDLSPDERYVYYLPGAHGQAGESGTAVVQYDARKNQQKVLAFLFDPMSKAFNYEPGGTYGIKISADGSTLYANLNGALPKAMRLKPNLQDGFSLTAFAAIHIPESERAK